MVKGAGVFFKGERFGLVTPPFRLQKFLWAFREMFALFGNVLQLLDKRVGGVLQLGKMVASLWK